MITITVSPATDPTSASLAGAPAAIALALQQALTKGALKGVSIMQGFMPGLIGVRGGNLRRRVRARPLEAAANGWTVAIVDDAPYADIQDQGGTIVPRNAQALAIPLNAMLTDAGVARGTAAQVKADPAAFGFVSTFIPKGHHVIMGKMAKGKNAEILPLFSLNASVTLPAHHFVQATVDALTPIVQDYAEQATGEACQVVMGTGA